jgi:hypothetical protein
MTEGDILAVLRQKFSNSYHRENWVFFEKLRIGTGYGKDADQTLDAWALALWPSNGFARIAYEIKTSRADFLREVAHPLKRRRALLFSNEFYFVTPAGLVKPDEVPLECGLMELAEGDTDGVRMLYQATVAAPWRDTPPPTWRFFAAIARRVQRTEKEVK